MSGNELKFPHTVTLVAAALQSVSQPQPASSIALLAKFARIISHYSATCVSLRVPYLPFNPFGYCAFVLGTNFQSEDTIVFDDNKKTLVCIFRYIVCVLVKTKLAYAEIAVYSHAHDVVSQADLA